MSGCAHATCTAHRHYLLSCDEYVTMREAVNECCALCGLPEAQQPTPRLQIDHDPGVGQWAVRGLLCVRCNTSLFDPVTRGLPAQDVASYLGNAWWHTLPPPIAEPLAVGAVVLGRWSRRWVYDGAAWNGKHRTRHHWWRMAHMEGPYLRHAANA